MDKFTPQFPNRVITVYPCWFLDPGYPSFKFNQSIIKGQ